MKKQTIIEVSTAHITKEDNDNLQEMSDRPIHEPLNIGALHYGYVIILPVEEEYFQLTREDCEKDYDMSESFWKMMRHAFDNKYRAILLDCDAEVIEGLPTNNW